MTPESEVVDGDVDTGIDTSVDTTVDTPETETVDTGKPVTMEDTLRTKFRELTKDPAVAAETKDEKTPAEKPAVIVDDQGRVRGPDGKFAPKVEDAPKVEATAQKTLETLQQKTLETPAAPTDAKLAKAPTSWSAEAQAEYVKLPPAIQAQVHKREDDFHKGYQSFKQKADTFDLLDSEIRPYEAMIRAAGTNPQAVIRDFFNTAYKLRNGTPESKVETILNVAKEYGVDLTLMPIVEDKLAQGQHIVAPEYQQLQQQFTQLQETLAQRDAREKQERDEAARMEQESTATQIAQWSQGKEHYNAVKLHMAALLESNQAKDLDDAYSKATWADPNVRERLLAQQLADRNKQAAEKAAAAKKAASTNVAPRGTPPARPATKVGTMEDTIRETLRKLQATG